jgi:hypothetical protein
MKGTMQTNFLFMDDSFHSETRISSLTGVIVPMDRYSLVRDGFYALLGPIIRPSNGVIRRAPELHGCDFLRDESDETKLDVLRGIVSLTLQQGLRVYRAGYFITPEIERTFPTDKRMLGTCFHSLLSMMHTVLGEESLIPVMDGLDKKNLHYFSAAVKWLDEMRTVGMERHLSLKFTQNLLGEVFYADSAHSVLIQLADILAYLRNKSDLTTLGHSVTPFNERLWKISADLKSCIIWEEIISFVVDGNSQGPKEYVRGPYAANGPLTRSFRITPSDMQDIATQRKAIEEASG